MGVGNKIWGKQALLGLDGMVVDQIWSKRPSSDGLGDPIVSMKARLGQQGHSHLRLWFLWIRTRSRHWRLEDSFALELEHLDRCRNRSFL